MSAQGSTGASEPPPSTLPKALQALSRVRKYARGEMLFHRGDPTRWVFFVYSGEVRMLRSGRAGEDVLLHRAHAGEYFAEAALDCPSYLCDAMAFQSSTVAVIPKSQLAALIRDDREFAMQWCSLLTRELRLARERIERLSLSGVAERVRHFILSEGSDGRCEVALPGSLKHLARELGVSHEALYRTLAKMREAGEIHRHGDRLWLAESQRAKRSPPQRR